MPGNDRTGPTGYGPMTGRRLGPCARGMDRGMGFRFSGQGYAPTKEQELADLNAEKEMPKQELGQIDTRLKELESKDKE